MAIPNFNQGYPPDGSSLGQTKSTIRDNLDGTFLTLGVDHINNNGLPNDQPAGYHNVTRWVPQTADPGTVANYGQGYSKTVGAGAVPLDQQLFWKTGVNGIVTQLTGPVAPSAAGNGYTTLPGGIILQWGTQNTVSPSSGTVTFAAVTGLAFPNTCFNVQITPFYAGTVPGEVISIALQNLSATKFNWLGISLSHNYTGFFWMAIGN